MESIKNIDLFSLLAATCVDASGVVNNPDERIVEKKDSSDLKDCTIDIEPPSVETP